jgi:hypothetical protein
LDKHCDDRNPIMRFFRYRHLPEHLQAKQKAYGVRVEMSFGGQP